MSRTFGIDVSYHQGSIDFRQAVTGGARFAYIKCSQNKGTDKNFQTNWKAAKVAGLMRGAYHFGDYNQYAQPQAAYFASVLQNDRGELPPVLDIEPFYGYALPARPALLGWIEQFMLEVYQSMGVRALIYVNPATIKHLSPIPTDLLAHDLWLAHYLYPASIAAGWQPTFKPWSRYTFWQYTDRADGTKYGTTSKQVDGNYFNGDYNSLLAYSRIYTGGAPVQPDKTLDDRVTALEVAARAHGWNV